MLGGRKQRKILRPTELNKRRTLSKGRGGEHLEHVNMALGAWQFGANAPKRLGNGLGHRKQAAGLGERPLQSL